MNAAEIIAAAPQVKVLVTSRETLNLQQEWVRPIQGMGYPDDGVAENLEQYSAMRLFVERAKRVRGDFSLKKERDSCGEHHG